MKLKGFALFILFTLLGPVMSCKESSSQVNQFPPETSEKASSEAKKLDAKTGQTSGVNASQKLGSQKGLTLTQENVAGCLGAKLRTVTVPDIGLNHGLFVLGIHALKGKELAKSLVAQKIKVKVIVNGSFFNEKTGVSTTYFKGKTSVQETKQIEHTQAVFFPERACLGYSKSSSEKLSIKSFLTPNNNVFKSSAFDEVFCAGPKAIENSTVVVSESVCQEKFSPGCRSDKQDPISVNHSQARTATCFIKSSSAYPTLKIFQVSSELWNCGLSLQDMAKKMKEANCQQGLFHDGGNSSAMVVLNGSELEYFHGPKLLERAVPVWLGVSEL
jgi:Phosphodiester glycosidase